MKRRTRDSMEPPIDKIREPVMVRQLKHLFASIETNARADQKKRSEGGNAVEKGQDPPLLISFQVRRGDVAHIVVP